MFDALAGIFDQTLEEESKVFERESPCNAQNRSPSLRFGEISRGIAQALLQLDECPRNPEIL